MTEPRLMRNPNGGVLCVDVTLLQMGLSRCRSIAEEALAAKQAGQETNTEAVLESIISKVRATLYAIEEHDVMNEVEAVLRDETS